MSRVERQHNDGDPCEERHESDKHAPEWLIVEIESHRQAGDLLPVFQPVGLSQQQPSKDVVDRKSNESDERPVKDPAVLPLLASVSDVFS